jgi:formamidopyrimidine-DNA glycosylase
MSGRFSIATPDDPYPAHTHFRALLDDGREIRFVDPRTFGFIAVYSDDELDGSGVGRLGPDAWAEPPAAEQLRLSLSRRTAPIKALLLDQGPISGLGNIYADEALYLARIHPLTPGGELTTEALGRLGDAIGEVLVAAIENGGTSLDDLGYLRPDGTAGENLDQLAVYGRTDLPCPRCGTPIERIVIRARSSHYCPNCQRFPE